MYLYWFKNLCRAALNLPKFVKALLTAKQVPFEIAQDRLFVCHNCTSLDPITRQCTHCWCFVRLKVQWQDEACPIGKWQKALTE